MTLATCPLNADKIVSEFGPMCIRVHFLEMNPQWMKAYKKADHLKIFRKEGADKFVELKTLKVSGQFPDATSGEKKSVNGMHQVDNNILESFRSKGKESLMLSFFHPENSEKLGSGFSDCSISGEKVYQYKLNFISADKTILEFPDQPIKMIYTENLLSAPDAEKVEPKVKGAEIYFRKPANIDKRLIILGFNIYRQAGKHTEKINQLPLVVSSERKIFKFSDSGQEIGKKIRYFATTVSFSGWESKPGKGIDFIVRDLSSPALPQGVKVADSLIGFEISWNPQSEKNIVGYNVYSAKGDFRSEFRKINPVLIPSKQSKYLYIPEIKIPGRYLFRVSAVNKAGNEGMMSTAAFLEYQSSEQPAKPEGIVVISTAGGNTITWKKSFNKEIKGFLVYRSESLQDNAAPISRLLEPDTDRYLDKQRISGRMYWYTVRSFSRGGKFSEYPAPVMAESSDGRRLPAPKNFRCVATNDGFLLTWKPIIRNNLKGYEIFSLSGSSRKKLNSDLLSPESASFLHITRDAAVSYMIRSVNTQNQSGTEESRVNWTERDISLNLPEVKIFRSAENLSLEWDMTVVFTGAVLFYGVTEKNMKKSRKIESGVTRISIPFRPGIYRIEFEYRKRKISSRSYVVGERP